MLYLTSAASSPVIRDAMRAGEIGLLITPADRRKPAGYPVWAADNGCFGKGYPGDAGYLTWLDELSPHVDRCLFAVAPDVVGDHEATLARSRPFFTAIRELGYPVAFVAQDGLTADACPWDEFDVLFIGGSTDWKLGPDVVDLCFVAHQRGVPVHLGRVNSAKRLRHAAHLGCATADGTFLAFGPDQNLPRMRRWTAALDAAPPLPLG